MNCPKCNAPINEGDKFCQTCGSVISQEPKVEESKPVIAEQQNQPVINSNPMATNQTMNNMGDTQQPLNNNMPGPQPMNYNQTPMNQNQTKPLEPKKNNLVVYILAAIIIVLLAVVIFLALPSDKEEDKDNNNNNNNEVTENNNKDDEEKDPEEDVIASNYTKSNVNEYTFELPEGYSAGYYNDYIVFYDENMTDVQGYVSSMSAVYSNVDKEITKANITASGIENVSYVEKKVNNKNMLIYSGEYQGYAVEIIYVEYSYTKVVAAEAYYTSTSTKVKEEVYDIMTRVVVDDSAFSTTTNTRVPGLDVSSAIGQ